MYALNVLTTLNASQAAIPHLAASGAGRIVNVGAMGAVQAGAGMGPMRPPRPACIGSPRRSLPNGRARSPSTLCCLRPSTPPANRASMPNADFAKWVRPQELSKVILFLASDAASAVTGALLPVSGRV